LYSFTTFSCHACMQLGDSDLLQYLFPEYAAWFPLQVQLGLWIFFVCAKFGWNYMKWCPKFGQNLLKNSGRRQYMQDNFLCRAMGCIRVLKGYLPFLEKVLLNHGHQCSHYIKKIESYIYII
jgi:hypothetical protein